MKRSCEKRAMRAVVKAAIGEFLSMENAELLQLRAPAERFRRLARAITHKETIAVLNELAAEAERKIDLETLAKAPRQVPC
jgi:hypothetical protein